MVVDNIYVINMDRSEDRLKNMTSQIPKLGRPFIRVPAVDGRKLSSEEIKKVSSGMCGVFCTHSMIGCFLSHQKAWRTLIENGDRYAVIMEDDCEVTDTFRHDLQLVMDELLAEGPDFVYLGCFGGCDYDKKKYSVFANLQLLTLPHLATDPLGPSRSCTKELEYSYVPEAPVGFHCYVISRDFAQRLLKAMPLADYHIDVSFISVANKMKAKVYASKKKIGYQFTSAEASTQSVHNFPITCNYILDKIKDSNGISYSFYFSSPLFEVFSITVNLYLIVAILIAIFTKNKGLILHIFSTFLFVEFLIQPQNLVVILYWLFVIGVIIKARKQQNK
ncbi:MAG: glycosyltransferase family 25 protein [Proteobacteria bacterium]|nr:glycosyltransferase family 25 protein [Pseudomonadota bacterium]NBP13271.1 glycosyltransferase family 25 protein [bacterium]